MTHGNRDNCTPDKLCSHCQILKDELDKNNKRTESEKTIEIPLDYAKNILKILEMHVSMGFEIVSQEIKDIVWQEAYDKLVDIHMKYHNANCGPFNEFLEKKIKECEHKK